MEQQLYVERAQGVFTSIRAQAVLIEGQQPDAAGLVAHWDDFWPAHLREVQIFAQNFVRTALNRISSNFMGSSALNNEIRALIAEYEEQIDTMVFSPDLYKTK